MSMWKKTSDILPPVGVVVMTKIDDDRGVRNVQPLRRHGRMWLYPYGTMYVYYTPTHWRYNW